MEFKGGQMESEIVIGRRRRLFRSVGKVCQGHFEGVFMSFKGD